MPSPFHGINLASQALRAFQRQLDVTGHNIGNVNTPGYTRQVAELQAAEGSTVYGIRPFSLGNGVNVLNVNRIRDNFLDQRMMTETSQMGRFNALAGGLNNVQAVINEPSVNGISDALNQFFNAWSGLASNPGTPGARQLVQSTGNTLAQRVSGMHADLSAAEQQAQLGAEQTLIAIDDVASRIGQLNAQIRQKLATGELPNDLLDARTDALKQLSEMVNVTTQENSDGGISVYVNQFTLVDGQGSRPIPKTIDAATGTVSDGAMSYPIKGGKLNGFLTTMNTIGGYKAQLDTLANTLRTSFNGVHATGVNANGTTGIAFFNDVVPPATQTGAVDFALDPAILADDKNIAAGVSGAAGDGGIALALSRLRDDATIPGLGGQSITEFYSDLVGQVGRDVAYYKDAQKTQDAVIQQIDLQIQSISGVSLDEEMANMLRFQRSYQAAARALSLFDQVTEDLINLIRR